ncbi:Cytochrome P450 2B11 [Galemys pyrenaicus]|uniref:Cytochrome P450 n=1 Tax=Galemys pyrenaicus TaxID=202257 RepID=A0A8J6DKT9_GALPY|nr:Cytochrome P450 2B11 [Galemys pyrenaicus]
MPVMSLYVVSDSAECRRCRRPPRPLPVLVRLSCRGPLSAPKIYSLFPALLRHLPGPHNRLFEVFEKQKEFVALVVKEHEASLDPAQPRDFIDAFLIRMRQEQGDPHTEFNQENLLNSALDIFFAGMETTSTTLRYGLLILLKYPQVTELVQQEIDRVVGPGRRPCLGDRPQMPYTEAVLHEILRERWASRRKSTFRCCLGNSCEHLAQLLPQGTMVFPMLHSVLHDPDWFQDPCSFWPERFLDANGAFQKNPAFLPFSAGRRACPGEPLAQAELFLYLTWLLQRFSPSSPLPPAALDLQPQESGFGKQPPPFELILQPRWRLQGQALSP